MNGLTRICVEISGSLSSAVSLLCLGGQKELISGVTRGSFDWQLLSLTRQETERQQWTGSQTDEDSDSDEILCGIAVSFPSWWLECYFSTILNQHLHTWGRTPAYRNGCIRGFHEEVIIWSLQRGGAMGPGLRVVEENELSHTWN